MEAIKLLMKLMDGYKTYGSAIAAVLAALALIFGGNYLQGFPALLTAIQAIVAIASGAAVMSLRQAVSKVEPPR